jgi:uncharacterized protein (DUF983 family)
MYIESNPYKLRKILKMHDHCSHCGLRFKIEPSFFYGAMYVSYAVGVAIGMAAFVVAYLLFGMDKHYLFFAIILALVVTFPLIIRISRNIWINFFVDYDENAAKDHKSNI